MRRGSALLLTLVLVALPLLASCSSTEEAAGSGFRLSADQLRAPDEPPPPDEPEPGTTEVATVTGAAIDVWWQKPDDPPAPAPEAEPAGFGGTPAPASASASLQVPAQDTAEPPNPLPVPPIPRDGYNSAGAAKIPGGWRFDNPTFFGNPLVFTVTAKDGDWLKVRIPVRPNNLEGWIRASEVTLSGHQYRVHLDVSDARLQAFRGNELIADTLVVVGRTGTPTPLGTFYLTEKLEQKNPGGAYGAWIFPLNAYSETLDEFDGGLPVVALHGTNNPGIIGSAASNGCVRMPNEVIIPLAAELPAGTPVEIVA